MSHHRGVGGGRKNDIRRKTKINYNPIIWHRCRMEIVFISENVSSDGLPSRT